MKEILLFSSLFLLFQMPLSAQDMYLLFEADKYPKQIKREKRPLEKYGNTMKYVDRIEDTFAYDYRVHSGSSIIFLSKDRNNIRWIDLEELKNYSIKKIEDIYNQLEPLRELDRKLAEERRQRFIKGTANLDDHNGRDPQIVKYWHQFKKIFIVEIDKQKKIASILEVKIRQNYRF